MQESDKQYPRPYGKYTLLETIGQGGMSAIDLAHESVVDANYMRFLIIKRMHTHLTEEDQSYVRMFQDEARITQELRHAKIAQVYTFGNIGQEYYLAMEYVPGVNLRELQQALARRGKGLPIRITLRILVDILEALDYAHNRMDTFGHSMNIVHRDVNPRNVMLSIQGEVKLIDFGVAKSENRHDKTVGHAIKGKFAYMAPEQIDPKLGQVDGRTDMFAVGLMLYELVAGRRAFHQLTEVQIMHRLLSGEIPTLPLAPDHPQPELLQSIYEKCITKNMDDRFANAGEFAVALKDAAQHCQGLASEQELASFLRLNIGSKLNEITQRLNQYKEEHTGSIQRPDSGSSMDDTDFGTLHKPGSHTYIPPVETTVVQHPQFNTLKLILAGSGLFVLGISAVLWMGSTRPEQPEQLVLPTNISTSETTIQNNEPVQEPSNNPDRAPKINNTTSDVQKDLKMVTDTPTTKPRSTKKIKTVSAPPKVEAKSPPETTSTDNTHGQTLLTTPKNDNTLSNNINTEIERTEPQSVALHNVILLVGTNNGIRGLPVMLNGSIVTQTGSKKSVELPEGQHTLEIIDPKTGLTHREKISVTPNQSLLTVKFSNL